MTHKFYIIKDGKGKRMGWHPDYRDFYTNFLKSYKKELVPLTEFGIFDFEGVGLSIRIKYMEEGKILLIGPSEDCLDNTVMKIEHDFKGKYKFEEVK